MCNNSRGTTPEIKHSYVSHGKATTSLERRYTEMVQGDWDPDDRSQQLGEGQLSECLE